MTFMVAGIILEGVTGTGKTSTLSALSLRSDLQLTLAHGEIFAEDRTFGDFMRESRTNPYSMDRLEATLDRIERKASQDPRYVYILERFHFSYNTFARDWSIYRSIEKRLSALNCGVVLLTIPEGEMVARSLHRTDMIGTNWVEQIVSFFGSYQAALAAIVESARRRRDDLNNTILPWIEINTASCEWPNYAGTAMKFLAHLVAAGRVPVEDREAG
jgi:hypothetical protein